jgi:hypothetical protein
MVVYTLLGYRLSLKAYPAGEPVRDQSHLSLLAAFDERIAPTWRRTREAVMPIHADLRAWDERLDGPVSIGVEAETRIRDIQAVVRSMTAKPRGQRRAARGPRRAWQPRESCDPARAFAIAARDVPAWDT